MLTNMPMWQFFFFLLWPLLVVPSFFLAYWYTKMKVEVQIFFVVLAIVAIPHVLWG